MSYTSAEMARIIEDMISRLDPSGTRDFDVVLRDVGNGTISVTLAALEEESMPHGFVPGVFQENSAMQATLH